MRPYLLVPYGMNEKPTYGGAIFAKTFQIQRTSVSLYISLSLRVRVLCGT